MSRRPPYAERRAAGQRKAIHVLRRQLGLERDVYESILQRVAGVASSTQLDDAGRDRVLDELRRLAGEAAPTSKPRKSYPGKPHNFYSTAMPEMAAKIEAQLADMKLPWSYADSIAKRMFRIERVAWVRDEAQLRSIIAALHVEAEKRGSLAHVQSERERLRITDAEWAELTAGLPRGWERNRRALAALTEYLDSRAT